MDIGLAGKGFFEDGLEEVGGVGAGEFPGPVPLQFATTP